MVVNFQVGMDPPGFFIQQQLNGLARDIGSFRGLFDKLIDDVFRPAFRENFESLGKNSPVGKWESLTDAYKLQRQRDFGNTSPILDRHRGAVGLKHRSTEKRMWEVNESQGEAFVDITNYRQPFATYAQALHEGYDPNNLPARPWFYITDTDRAKAERAIERWLRTQVAKRPILAT